MIKNQFKFTANYKQVAQNNSWKTLGSQVFRNN